MANQERLRCIATVNTIRSDARRLPIADEAIDLVVTSPPYFKKRDYGHPNQLGQERTPAEYIAGLSRALKEIQRVLRPSGSAFLNIGDSYNRRGSLVGVPGLVEQEARRLGWRIRNRIIWSKPTGMPSPVRNRLVSRHEIILHMTKRRHYYYDLHGYLNSDATPNAADVWEIPPVPSKADHLAPYPDEIVRRAILLACPMEVCTSCGAERRRIVRKTRKLDTSRPQARRALQIAEERGLTRAHIAAVQATGISDAGKGLRIQGAKNGQEVQQLASEAKEALGGYFREFTFPKWESKGFSDCGCEADWRPGVVLDPFAGSGTTLRVAASLGRSAIGLDLENVPVPLVVRAEKEPREGIRRRA